MLNARVPIDSLADEANESEKVVLGSLILDPSLLSGVTVSGQDFCTNHQKIFDSMLSVYGATGSFDPYLIVEEMRRRRQSWEGAFVYVSSLTDGLPRRLDLKGHCERLKNASLRRRMARLCEKVLSGCHDLTSDPSQMIADLRKQAADIDAPAKEAFALGLISAADVQPETIEWLIAPYVPRKCLSLLVGDPGDGKTWVALSLSACLTRGILPFVGGTGRPQTVLYLSNEDGPGELRTRFDTLGGDPSRIWFESAEHAINLGQAEAIEAAVKKHDASLVIFDTVTSHFGAKVDFHKASEVSAVLGPLAAMGQRTGAAVVGLMHLSKSMQGKSLYRVQGSTAFAGAARSVMGAGHDPSDPTKRILVHIKVNGSAQGSSREFTIDDRGVTWGALSGLGAADVLGPDTTTENRSGIDAAVEFIRQALAGGSRDAAEVIAEAKEQSISERTLYRAKATLKVKSRKKTAFDGGWIWWLEANIAEDCQVCQEGGQGDPTVQ